MTTAQTMTNEQMMAEIARLKAQNAKLIEDSQRALTVKVSEKGAVMVLGLQRFPVTLYASQWERVANEMPRILRFIKENASVLKQKGE